MDELLENEPSNDNLLTIVEKVPVLAERAFESLVDAQIDDYYFVFGKATNLSLLQSAWNSIKEMDENNVYVEKVNEFCINSQLFFRNAPDERDIVLQNIKCEAVKILGKSQSELITERIVATHIEALQQKRQNK